MISYLPVISSVTIPSIPFQSGLDVLIDIHHSVLQELPAEGWLLQESEYSEFFEQSYRFRSGHSVFTTVFLDAEDLEPHGLGHHHATSGQTSSPQSSSSYNCDSRRGL